MLPHGAGLPQGHCDRRHPGVDSTFFSVVPNNSLGKSAVRMLRSNDVHCTQYLPCVDVLLGIEPYRLWKDELEPPGFSS